MFRLLDRLVYREMIGPWVFGVALFTVVLMAGTYLFRLTDFLVKGVEVGDVFRLSMLYMPGLVAKTFPMAVLLASLLAFARLSNDSEVIAAQAGGASLVRIMWPVSVFGFAVSALTFVFGEMIVPPASLEAAKLQAVIAKQIRRSGAQPFYQPLYVEGKLRGGLMARDVNLGSGTMVDVLGVWYGAPGQPWDVFVFKELYFSPDREWRIREGTTFRAEGGKIYSSELKDAHPPPGMVLDFAPRDILAASLRDTDSLSMAELGEQIGKLKANPRLNLRRIRDLEVGYWTKISLPLSSLVFALVGAPVAIRRVRQGIGMGVAVSIMIIFAYYLLHNYFTILAKGGYMNPALSALIPVGLGMIAVIILMIGKSR